ncbi:hypothetical protein CPB83DRAFT_795955 [Crepidotus variabilis]|uniref:PIN domain-like protein n=1 Tax=Crepidotus variabilis TaxID=179855 RepID=A0A9P6EAT8_9AGAR|nr:hypothetical protein CPB83DRAFT_795955 [Crepidotus variabilis]
MGVKSLWTLLTPVGRPVMLETVEGKVMAIDSSIWIYQFQATMRDKEGRALVNAHVLGFLRRLSKLLFYGIKPVFVFDGGAPALKKNTLTDRRKKKSGAASSHVKLAEKLLAAQMRKEALNHAQSSSSYANGPKTKSSGRNIVLDENTVYFEDLEPSALRTPAKKKPLTPSSSAKQNRFHDHDPYRLPEVDLEAAIAKATRSTVPDPRLATEDELRLFIEEMRPEDFDVTSPAFKELPTEVQYEIVGDLRLKSRQTSYARLQKMLQTSQTPLDFSKQQIQNLRQRNSLTQQLFITTDSIGSAHIAIPVRIASERNKEYVLVKNEGESGGWILGIRDTGTRDKPITLDHDDEQLQPEEDSDAEMEEVHVPTATLPDPDLQEYHRDMALSSIGSRGQQKKTLPPAPKPINRRSKSSILFENMQDDQSDSDDGIMAYAIQRSLEDASPMDLSRAASSSTSHQHTVEDDDFYVDPCVPNRLETALSIAGAGPSRLQSYPIPTLFGNPTLLSSPSKKQDQATIRTENLSLMASLENFKTTVNYKPQSLFGPPSLLSTSQQPQEEVDANIIVRPVEPNLFEPGPSSILIPPQPHPNPNQVASSGTPPAIKTFLAPSPPTIPSIDSDDDIGMEEVPVQNQESISPSASHSPKILDVPPESAEPKISMPIVAPPSDPVLQPLFVQDPSTVDLEEKDGLIAWSRSPSPTMGHLVSRPTSPTQNADWDAAHEMDIQAEEGEFARFISQVKGRNMKEVRKEIDDEIKHLNDQRKAAMRDSEDITQQMIAQIMTLLRLFGIPYITAPMEAEAQCAELVTLNLVDGVITDDSDVFLFGAQRVYKNMFNQSKTVECFLLTDLSRELGLNRDTLVQLAYLLGSDYTEGLPGVGPVVAMELLKEFPGRDGLHKFKDWWTKVQSGKDRSEDNQSKFRKQFKKKFKNLYLPSDWPNTIVRDAYYHPTVDSSEEPFKWGMPDLDGLRLFLQQELGWKQDKVDELLLPIIQKMNKRNQAAALNKQGNLNDFLDLSAGSGTHAPRQRQAYASKRLQQVISDFRNRQRSASPSGSRASSQAPGEPSYVHANADTPSEAPKKRKRATATKSRAVRGRGGPSSSSRGKGRRRADKGKPCAAVSDDDEQDENLDETDGDEFAPGTDVTMGEPITERDLRPRPKPRPTRRNLVAAQTQREQESQ